MRAWIKITCLMLGILAAPFAFADTVAHTGTPTVVPLQNQPSVDLGITSDIETQLASDKALSGQNITATTQNGVVTLNGAVENEEQAAEAIRVAKAANGVTEVKSNIVLKTAY